MGNFQKWISHIALKYFAVPKLPTVEIEKKKIACIGDSITFGAGVNGKREQTWEYFLENRLDGQWQVLNYGISGRTMLSSGDYPYRIEKQYSASKDVLADIYIIMLGSNDSKPYNWVEAKYKQELEDFVLEYSKLANKPKVVVMTPPACFEDPALGMVNFDINKDIVANEIYRIVKGIAEKNHIQMIDLHTLTTGHADWFVDGVHPNEKGNKEIAAFIFNELNINGI